MQFTPTPMTAAVAAAAVVGGSGDTDNDEVFSAHRPGHMRPAKSLTSSPLTTTKQF